MRLNSGLGQRGSSRLPRRVQRCGQFVGGRDDGVGLVDNVQVVLVAVAGRVEDSRTVGLRRVFLSED